MAAVDAGLTAAYVARLEKSLNQLVRRMAQTAGAHPSTPHGPDLSGSQRNTLRALVTNGPFPVSEVANLLGVTLSAATGLVDRLARATMVTRERDQKDRRVVWVRITPVGEEALRTAEQRRQVALRQIVQQVPGQDLATLCDILERLGEG